MAVCAPAVSIFTYKMINQNVLEHALKSSKRSLTYKGYLPTRGIYICIIVTSNLLMYTQECMPTYYYLTCVSSKIMDVIINDRIN